MNDSTIAIQASELVEIVGSVFATMLRLEVRESGDPWFPCGNRLTSAVHLTGDWNGAVLFECDRGHACELAGRFLSIDPPHEVDDIVRDVVGELANMIGGNLKCILTRGIHLSVPAVVDGSDYTIRLCGSGTRERVAFRGAGETFWVTLLSVRP
jgi:CheY-specific phosphatase CheX